MQVPVQSQLRGGGESELSQRGHQHLQRHKLLSNTPQSDVSLPLQPSPALARKRWVLWQMLWQVL